MYVTMCVCFYHVADQQNWMQLPTWEFEKNRTPIPRPGPCEGKQLTIPKPKSAEVVGPLYLEHWDFKHMLSPSEKSMPQGFNHSLATKFYQETPMSPSWKQFPNTETPLSSYHHVYDYFNRSAYLNLSKIIFKIY